MNKEIVLRIFMDLVMAVSIFFGWWYVALPVGIVGLFKFPYFLELILAGFVYDSLFGMGSGLGFMAKYAGIVTCIAFSVIVFAFKRSFR